VSQSSGTVNRQMATYLQNIELHFDRVQMKAVQIKMARAALGWGVRELAERAGITANTVTRIENGADAKQSTMDALQAALESAGIEFTNGGQSGVKIKGWYTELYDATSTRAKSYTILKDFAGVRALILRVRKAKTGEIVRVCAPLNASRDELDELEKLGAKRF
jgi:transcriptional regulator with XRE-family HTH domain